MRKEGEALKYNADCFFKQVRVTNHQASPGQPTFSGLLQLDFDVDAGRQIELHQGVHRLVGGIHDVHQTLVRADFKLVTAGLVDVRRAQDVKTLHARWQGHGALDNSAGALGGVNDFSSGLVDQLVIESLQTDADFLLGHGKFLVLLMD